MNLPDLLLLLHHQLLQDFLLFPHHSRELNIDNLRIELAAHQGGSFVFFNKPSVDRFREFEVFTEALLLEITNSELISKCEEMMNSIFDVIILQHTVCHQLKETKQLKHNL